MKTIKNQKTFPQRHELLDQLRGFAVAHMIFFHFCFNLNFFALIDVDFHHDFIWWFQPRFIVANFMLVVGASLYFAHHLSFRLQAFFKRFIKLVAGAFIISLTTYLALPDDWIYFGTLHSIATCSVLSILFVKIPRISGIIGLLVIFSSLLPNWQWPWIELSHTSLDYIPPLPWVGWCLLGIMLAKFGVFYFSLSSILPHRISQTLIFLGKHSLKIYLLHQLILFPLAYGLTFFI